MHDVPDGREVTGGPGVFAFVEGGLAADAGGTGEQDARDEKSPTETHKEVKRDKRRSSGDVEIALRRGQKVKAEEKICHPDYAGLTPSQKHEKRKIETMD